MNKRARSDSITKAAQAMRGAALGPIEPPAHVHLREGDRAFWDDIVRARERSTWTESDLATAANLARAKADVERIQKEIDLEGDCIKNDRGTLVVNPRHALLETLSRRVMALSRLLHVHAEATVGESRDQAKGATQESRAAATLAETDDLIPRLRAV